MPEPLANTRQTPDAELEAQLDALMADISDKSPITAAAASTGNSDPAAGGVGIVSTPSGNPKTSAPACLPTAPDANDTDDQTAGEVLRQIDEHLAQEADNVSAGDFETVPQVEDLEKQAAAARPTTATAADEATSPAALAAETKQTTLESTVAAVPSGGATAADDVAGELDRDARTAAAQTVPAAAKADSVKQMTNTAKTTADLPAAVGSGPAAPRPNPKAAVRPTDRGAIPEAKTRAVSAVIQRLLGTIHRPLARLSPTARSAVGYIGLLILFNAVVWILAMLIASHFKH